MNIREPNIDSIPELTASLHFAKGQMARAAATRTALNTKRALGYYKHARFCEKRIRTLKQS